VFLLVAAFAALKALGRLEIRARNGFAIALAALGTYWFLERLAMGDPKPAADPDLIPRSTGGWGLGAGQGSPTSLL
jgi:hypothetical protein